MNTYVNVIKTAVLGDSLKYTGDTYTGRYQNGKEYPVIKVGDRLTITDDAGMNPPPWWGNGRFTFDLVKADTDTLFGDMSREEQIELMTAHLDGKTVEYKFRGVWNAATFPSWKPTVAYRLFMTEEEKEIKELTEKLAVFKSDMITAQGQMNRLNNGGGLDFDCMSREAQGALLLAHHNGERIQFKSGWLSPFITLDEGVTPEWDNDTVYRVEPTEVAELKVKIDRLTTDSNVVQSRLDDLTKPADEPVEEEAMPVFLGGSFGARTATMSSTATW